MKAILRVVFACILLCVCASCGGGSGSTIYKNAYKSGYEDGQAHVRELKRLLDPKDYKNLEYGVLDASTSYASMKRSLPPASQDNINDIEDEYRPGWIDGYNDGVAAQLSSYGLKSSSKSGSSSSRSNGGEEKTGINFWQWCIILLVVFFVVGYLSPDEKNSKALTKVDNSSNMANDESSAETIQSAEVASPWKMLLLEIFTCILFFAIFSIFNLTSRNISTYLVLLLILFLNYFAFDDINKYRQNVRKDFLSGLVRVLAIIGFICIGLLFVMRVYLLLFG